MAEGDRTEKVARTPCVPATNETKAASEAQRRRRKLTGQASPRRLVCALGTMSLHCIADHREKSQEALPFRRDSCIALAASLNVHYFKSTKSDKENSMSIFGTFRSRTARTTRRLLQSRNLPASQLGLESLEDRRMMAFSVMAELTADYVLDFEIATIDAGSRPDLVYVIGSTPLGPQVGVRLGNSDGSFGAPITSAVLPYNPHSIVAADFTGDGKVDLVTTSYHDVNLLVANGNGTFQAPQSIGLPFQISPGYHGPVHTLQNPHSVAVGDLNADGKLDLTVGSSTTWISDYYSGYFGQVPIFTSAGHVNVLLGNGMGGFAVPVVHNLGIERLPQEISLADLNNNNKLDVVTANGLDLSVLLGDGTGGLGIPLNSGSGGAALQSISLGDIDGDGKLDTLLRGGPGLTVQKGDGAGRFAASTQLAADDYSTLAVLGDVNADGKLDVLIANVAGVDNGTYYPDHEIRANILLGNGSGGFSLPVFSSLGITAGTILPQPGLKDVALADITGDGLPEMALVDFNRNSIIIARNDGNWVAPPELSISDVSVVEGNSGTRQMTFTVSLSKPGSSGVGIYFSTANGSAKTSDNDYVAKSGSIYFNPGETSKTIQVTIRGDRKLEKNERFYVNLSDAWGGDIADSQGIGTILNDDGGKLNSFRSAFHWVDAEQLEDWTLRGKKKGVR